MVEGSLRGHQPLPMLGGSASAVIGNEGAAVAEEGVLEDGEGRQHKAMNPTTRKVRCRFHSEVVVKRHKLRTASVLTPCWRCLEEAKVQAHEGQKAAEARVDFLHCALQEEKEHGVVLERRAAALEEEQLGLRQQIAKLVEQVAGLSEELSNSLDANKRLVEQQRTRALLLGSAASADQASPRPPSPPPTSPSSASRQQAHKPPAAAVQPCPAGAVAAASTCAEELVRKAEGGQAGPHAPPPPPTPSATPAPTEAATRIQALAADVDAAAAAAVAAPSTPKPRPTDLGAEAAAADADTAARPLSPVAQSLGASGPSRIFRALKEQEAAAAAAAAATGAKERGRGGVSYLPVMEAAGAVAPLLPTGKDEASSAEPEKGQKQPQHKKKKKGWSLFSRSSRKKKRRGVHHDAEEEESSEDDGSLTAVVAPPSRPPPKVDELEMEEGPLLSVDSLAKKLLRMVDARPECLERIYRKSEVLEEWRMEAQLGLTLKAPSPSSSANGGDHQQQQQRFVLERRTSCLYEDQMELVGALTNYIRMAALRHVADCFRLAKSNPEVLRQALSVVRLHGDFQRRKLEAAKSKLQGHCTHLAGGEELKDLDTVLKLCALEDWDAEVRLTLKEAAALRALEVFSIAHMEAAGGLGGGVAVVTGGLSREGAMVAAAEALVEDLKEQLRAVCPFFAPEHRAAPTVAAQYDAHISRQVAALHEHGLSDLELGDLFEVNRFLQGYQEGQGGLLALGGLQPRPELAAAAKACLQECMVKTRQQMSAWYESILGRAAEALVDGDGRPFTANPEDLFQIVHTQVRVAADAGGFRGDDLCALLVVILTALKEFVAEHHSKLQGQRALDEPVLGVMQLCAVVNDYERLYDKATELRDALLGKGQLDPERHFDVLDHVLDQLHDEQARVSFEATRLVSFLVLRDASASLLQASPFDDPVDGTSLPPAASWAEWDRHPLSGGSNGAGGAAAAAAAAALVEKAKQQQRQKEVARRMARVDVLKDARLTIKDYFGDLAVWLPGYFFSHVVRASLEGLVVLYLVSVLRGRTLFGDVARVHHRMRQDKQALLDDFAPYKQQLEEQGVPDMLVPLGPWDDLMEVVLRGGEPQAPWTGYLLRTLPPPWHVDAVLQIRALRGEGLERKAQRQEARQRLLAWYRAEIAGEGGGKKKGTAGAGGRDVVWRLKTSPLAVRPGSRRAVTFVKEAVYNA